MYLVFVRSRRRIFFFITVLSLFGFLSNYQLMLPAYPLKLPRMKKIGLGQHILDGEYVMLRSDNQSIFSTDYIPARYNNSNYTDDITIHICSVTAKKTVADEFRLLVKSLILHARRADLHFHLIVYEGSEKTVPNIFSEIDCSFVNVYFDIVYVNLEEYIKYKLKHKIHISHESGVYALGKIFMFDIMKHVDTCLLVDTDLVFAVDPFFLWNELKQKRHLETVIGAAEDPTVFNSGVMLQNLDLMRQIQFDRLISLENFCQKSIQENRKIFKCYHDQDILNKIYKSHSDLFYFFTKSWNLGYCKGQFSKYRFSSFENVTKGLFFGAAHFTCMPKGFANAITSFAVRFAGQKEYSGLVAYVNYLLTLKFLTSPGIICPSTIRQNINMTFL